MARILIVDDSPTVLLGVGRLLTALGHSVRGALGFGELWELLPVFVPELALLDLEMPHVDGVAVGHYLRRRFPGMPIVMHSGESTGRLLEAASEVGASAIVRKGGPSGELERTIERTLELAQGIGAGRVSEPGAEPRTAPAAASGIRRAAPLDRTDLGAERG